MREHFRISEPGRQCAGTIRYGFHHCRAVVRGLKPEDAVSKLMAAGIDMMDLKSEDEISVSFCCSWSDYGSIRGILGKKYEVEVEKEGGFQMLLKAAVRRAGLTAGMVGILLMLLLQQSMITKISIDGAVRTDEARLRAALAEAGIEEGAFLRGDADLEMIRAQLLSQFSEIRWMGIRRQGSFVGIEVREGSPAQAPEPEGIFDLVAAKSGYVQQISAKEGFACVKPGDYVEKGQVLISAEFPLNNTTYDTGRDQGVRRASAMGTVTGTVIYRLRLEFPEGSYTEEEMKAIAEEKIRAYVSENIPEYIKMDNKDLKFRKEENIIVCSITLQITENIAEKKENELVHNNSGEDKNDGNKGNERGPADH